MTAKKKRTTKGIEWVGGIAALPAYVTGEGEPYRPEVLIWMIPDGPVLGFSTEQPGQLLAGAHQNLLATIRSPMMGPPHSPARLRVASPELASALREAVSPAIGIVCGPTPEIDHVIASMREKMVEDAETEQSYLSPEIDAEAVASFFRAAAGLFRAKPWSVVPDDQSLLSVTIERLDVHDAIISIIGQLGEALGFIVFHGLDGFEAYVDAADGFERGDKPEMPPFFALNFERGADLPTALRKEIAEHRWEVASPEAYPSVVAVDEDLVSRPLSAEELTITEAITLALLEAFGEKRPLLAAWNDGTPFTCRVKSHAGDIDVTLRAPDEDDVGDSDLLDELAELEVPGEDLDDDARIEIQDELVALFVASPEAKALKEVRSCHLVMDFAATHFGVTIASLAPAQLREIVFDLIPRKVTIEATVSSSLIAENRAFFAFLKREFGLKQADACLRVLGGDAVKKLEAAFSDRWNFGMAKSVIMGGRDAGFDVGTKEGVEAWMREVQGTPIPPGNEPPAGLTRKAAPTETRAKKNQRKAERKGRRKNR